MTNVLDGLLTRVPDPALRSAIEAEVERLRETKDFGLVFDRHIPENVRLYSSPVKRGSTVQESRGTLQTSWIVRRIADGKATLLAPDGSEALRAVDELVVIREFGQPIYPGLKSVGRIERGGSTPFHTVINGENFHALETLLYCCAGEVDVIYIDPPYNTGARDWKYNNDYVDKNDTYRHSKWLSFMEKRLRLSKSLLRPESSVLLVTIDDTEVCTLGLLLDDLFPGCERQMVSITISPRGKSREGRLSQVDEYLVAVYVGSASVSRLVGDGDTAEVRWRYLRRNDIESKRGTAKGGPNQFYPIFVDPDTQKIVKLGDPLRPNESLESVPGVLGAEPVFPIREDGVHMNWGLTAPSLQRALDGGYVRVTAGSHEAQPFTFAYLTRPNIRKVESGAYEVAGTRKDGSKIVVVPGGTTTRPTTAWRNTLYDAGAYGTSLLRTLIPGSAFPFPKSLYAVEDSLRLFIQDKPDALILDFFGGSGTTTHAVARINQEDGGRRRCILVTNNEVSEGEAQQLGAQGHRPGDPEWERQGIFYTVTMPRILAAVSGQDPSGASLGGQYKTGDKSPLADGLSANVEFLELCYLDPNEVARGKAFEAIGPLLWMKAGAVGPMVTSVSRPFIALKEASYAVLFDINHWQAFADAIRDREDLGHVFIITDSPAQYQQVLSELSPAVGTSMLYEDYLRNFVINAAGMP